MKLQDILLIGGGLAAAYFLMGNISSETDATDAAGVETHPATSESGNVATEPSHVPTTTHAVDIPSAGVSGVDEAAVAAALPMYKAAAQIVSAAGGQGGELLSHHVPGYTISGYVPNSLIPAKK